MITHMSARDISNREDVEIWRCRLVGKRLVTSSDDIAAWDDWKTPDAPPHFPRIYWCQPAEESLGRRLQYHLQPQSPLLSLPVELRLQILQRAVPPKRVEEPGQTARMAGDPPVVEKWMNTSAIIFCCKQLYVEARELAVGEHTVPVEDLPRRCTLGPSERTDRNTAFDL